jgi:hypothetical protein
VRNGLDYVISLYVGKKNLASHVTVAIALALVLIRGTRMARFAASWVLLALLPFVFFTWGNTSRYLYLPAMGFAMLVAEGVRWLDAVLARWLGTRWRTAVVGFVVAALAVRFAVFSMKAVRNFTAATQPYREYGQSLRRSHPTLPSGSVVFIDPATDTALKQRYLEGLVQWEYRDPTLKVRVRDH